MDEIVRSISPISRCCVQIFAYRDSSKEHQKRAASGFLWEANGRRFLVSNQHVLLGTNPLTRSVDFVPNRFELHLFSEVKTSDGRLLLKKAEVTLEHELAEHGDLCFTPTNDRADIAAIDITECELPKGATFLNRAPLKINYSPRVAEDVFIVGYPLGKHFEKMPLWKRGSIATDPAFDQSKVPQFFVDTLGHEGLSGAPVFTRRLPDIHLEQVENLGDHHEFCLVGVYSGRMGKNGFASEIGRVQKIEVLVDTIDKAVNKSQTQS